MWLSISWQCYLCFHTSAVKPHKWWFQTLDAEMWQYFPSWEEATAVAVAASVVTLAIGAVEILILVMNRFCLDSSLALEAVWWGKFHFWQLLFCIKRVSCMKRSQSCRKGVGKRQWSLSQEKQPSKNKILIKQVSNSEKHRGRTLD